MKKNKIPIILVLTVLIISVFSQCIYAATGCPKGKECTFRGCGRYSDTNGNSLCDVAESGSTDSTNESASSDNSPTQNSFDQSVDSGENQSVGNSNESQALNEKQSENEVYVAGNDSNINQEDVQTEAEEIEGEEEIEEAEEEENTLILGSENVKTSALTNAAAFINSNQLILIYALFLIAAAILYGLRVSRTTRDRIRLFLLVLSLGILGFYFGGCICPIGALQNLPLKLAGITSGQYFQWLILMLLPIVFIFLAGRIFCSSVCPLGAVQELTFRMGKKLGLNHGKPGLEKIKWLRYIKYGVLVWLIVFTAITGFTLFCSYDPFATLFALQGTIISTILLFVVLAGSLFISRPWCRIICPYGALLGIVNKIAGRRIHARCYSCNGCRVCTKECPVDAISITRDKKGEKSPEIDIDYFECINCKKCQ